VLGERLFDESGGGANRVSGNRVFEGDTPVVVNGAQIGTMEVEGWLRELPDACKGDAVTAIGVGFVPPGSTFRCPTHLWVSPVALVARKTKKRFRKRGVCTAVVHAV